MLPITPDPMRPPTAAELEDQLRLAQKLEPLGLLAAGIAHDFNNLLTIILGYLELLRPSVGEAGRPMAEGMARAANLAAELTARLLAYAQRPPATPGPVDVGVVLRETAEILRRTIDPRITITVDVPPNTPPVAADIAVVEHAVMNLCLNARDAMPTGGTLTLSAETVPPFVRISFADTGAGLTADAQANLFRPATARPGRGSGLGLAVVQRLVRGAGGRVLFETNVGRGTRFDIDLPAAEPIASRARGHVLVVEDEDAIRALVRSVLEGAGFTVTDTADAGDAITRARAAGPPFDLVICDLTLPGVTGAEYVPELRRVSPGSRFLVVTGLSEEEARAAGGDGFLAKPFTRTTLLSAVATVLGSKVAV